MATKKKELLEQEKGIPAEYMLEKVEAALIMEYGWLK